MGYAQDLVNAGYGGYQGWGDAEAAADFNATGGRGKESGGGVGGGGSNIPAFNFDYEKAATDAYGELGPYYTRLLTESQGDMNKVLARLVEDYNTGVRINKENTATSLESNQINKGQAVQRGVESALDRGIYSKSSYAPGYGIADTLINRITDPFLRREQALRVGQSRYEEAAGTRLKRQQVDIPEKQKRYEFNLEQRRRTEAANLANTRGARAYQDYLTKIQGASF